MPIQLPLAPACPTPLPAQPQNPASLVDISNAIEYNRNIRISQLAGGATKNDVGRGAVYEAAVIEDNAGIAVAPPWFQPAMNACLAPLIRSSNITHNLLCGDGHTRRFEIIPFINGDDPVHPPPGGPPALPPLTNIAAIFNLTGPEATSYLNGYEIPVPNLIIDRKNLIRIEIGCTAEF